MSITLNIDSNLTDDIGLMYFDPETDSLKEFNSSVYIACKSFSYDIKRFYLCGAILNYPCIITLTAATSDLNLYTVKVRLGDSSVHSYTSFNNTSEVLSINTSVLGAVYTNAIPIDILIESVSITEKLVKLHIELSADTGVYNNV